MNKPLELHSMKKEPLVPAKITLTLQDKLVHKAGQILGSGRSKKERTPAIVSSVIESDFERDEYVSHADAHIPGMNSYGEFDDVQDFHQCKNLENRLEQLIYVGRQRYLNCELLVPRGLLFRIAQDVLRMSRSEPCGIRGCIMFISIEQKSCCQKINKLVYDPDCTPTFELYLTLREETKAWAIMKKFLFQSVSVIFGNSTNVLPTFLCSGFQLEKKKLYRPNPNRTDSNNSKSSHDH
ncbi:damage-inducible transcript 4 [Octopus vulgaris]|uniref:Damage-inducible transcript 4 n=2 Tax=Octopus TaxID=6643 RepID=A0AA36AL69_OCTVU|nr:DNA damage-inducible transcript 4-like protein [Octopus sinensis]CAI9717524.1 damage-inducible transcript 4 [Octopus vulgaris]